LLDFVVNTIGNLPALRVIIVAVPTGAISRIGLELE
jgi:hypothetical protein